MILRTSVLQKNKASELKKQIEHEYNMMEVAYKSVRFYSNLMFTHGIKTGLTLWGQ